MGYLLPVQHYQYTSYHDRTGKMKVDPYPVEKLYQSQLPLAYQKQQKPPTANTSPISRKKLYSPTAIHQAAIEKIITDITGKGKYVNEKV
ncbi:hypothetical protein [Aquibacillus albus]|uniref:Zasp-like motif domain-containing protein n=1 Tax=Aquibacillus albus TaxID=1168171 RepID=A0ABS2N0C0_9BACI|nr:hypothetical protein [Aquibacillus albus]MBM7571557.1 hypothetical protein [Aquibacillus albus]